MTKTGKNEMTATIETPKEERKEKKQSREDYLKSNFLLEDGEYSVKFCIVAENSFRINFYKKVDPSQVFTSSIISRSYYVVLLEEDGVLTHKILE